MNMTNTGKIAAAVAGCTSGLFFALVATASPAGADPADVAPPPPPGPAVVLPAPAPGPAPGPAAVDLQASAPDPAILPPNGMPHLASPDALPPGSTMDPNAVAGGESPNVSFLRDLWQAVQNKEISGKEALVLGLSQRSMDMPIPAQAPGPNVPITPADPAPAPAPPAPDAPPAPAINPPAPTP
ncbi:MAG: signal peptide protein [Mycobacterium sp.]|jgi:hypothetical protein|nr:signal peptide protein [Mycobacterium sp.]MDT5178752.1 hypothetical protein [Mycobacterium sp.]